MLSSGIHLRSLLSPATVQPPLAHVHPSPSTTPNILLAGEQYIFVRVHDAVEHCKALMTGCRSLDLEFGCEPGGSCAEAGASSCAGVGVPCGRLGVSSIDLDAAGTAFLLLKFCSVLFSVWVYTNCMPD